MLQHLLTRASVALLLLAVAPSTGAAPTGIQRRLDTSHAPSPLVSTGWGYGCGPVVRSPAQARRDAQFFEGFEAQLPTVMEGFAVPQPAAFSPPPSSAPQQLAQYLQGRLDLTVDGAGKIAQAIAAGGPDGLGLAIYVASDIAARNVAAANGGASGADSGDLSDVILALPVDPARPGVLLGMLHGACPAPPLTDAELMNGALMSRREAIGYVAALVAQRRR